MHVYPRGRRGTIGAGLGAFELEYDAVPTTLILDPQGRVLDREAECLTEDGQNAHMETYHRRIVEAVRTVEAIREAAAELDAIEKRLGDDVGELEGFIRRCRELGLQERAVPHLERLTRIDPSADRSEALGAALLAAGRIADAERALAALRTLDPERHRLSCLRLMEAWQNAERPERAARLGQNYLRRYPRGPDLDEATWHVLKARPRPRDLEAFLRRFPESRRADEARSLLDR